MRRPIPADFLRHRSQVARDTAVQDVETTVQQLAKLVLNASALIDRMEARPARDNEEARERAARVKVLRDAAHAGREAIRRATAHLASDRAAELGCDSGQLSECRDRLRPLATEPQKIR